mmetsp:Transcript_10148/g.11650  ORF Transcript_10148/g.11650 Transcript_10148/m.11650 type:complete len:319 (-) Transcript_10148:625-1581(-)
MARPLATKAPGKATPTKQRTSAQASANTKGTGPTIPRKSLKTATARTSTKGIGTKRPGKITKVSAAKQEGRKAVAQKKEPLKGTNQRQQRGLDRSKQVKGKHSLAHSYAVWITKNSKVNVSENTLSKNLSDGVALCRLLKKAGVPRVMFTNYSTSNNQMLTLQQKKRNIAALRRSCMLINVKDADKLEYEHFSKMSNMETKLLPFLRNLSTKLSTKKYGIKPPLLEAKYRERNQDVEEESRYKGGLRNRKDRRKSVESFSSMSYYSYDSDGSRPRFQVCSKFFDLVAEAIALALNLFCIFYGLSLGRDMLHLAMVGLN